MSEADEPDGARVAEEKSARQGVLAGLDPMGTPKTPVWRLRWFQVALGGLVSLGVASYVLPPVFRLLYMSRPVLLPVLVGLALAYAVNPLVTWAARRHRTPRVFSAAVILIWFFGLLGLGFAWLTGPVVGQAKALVRDLPRYVEASAEAAGDWLEIPDVAREVMHEAAEGDLLEAAVVVLPPADPEGDGGDAAAVDAGPSEPSEPTDSPEVSVRVDSLDGDGETTRRIDVDDDGGVMLSEEPAPSDEPAAAEAGAETPGSGLLTRVLGHLNTLEWSTLSSTGMRVLDVGASTVIGVLGLAGYLAVATLVVCFCFFFATWRWPAFVAWWLPYLPASHKAEICQVAARMDRSVSAFLRGRLVQATILAVILCVGFTFVGTPGALILGIVGGACWG